MDPSLCDKQRQLKRAKLADTLSNQLQLRPGPLELIQKNILHADDTAVEQAVKEGQVEFRPTAEGLPLHQVDVPHGYTVSFDEDSNSEGGVQSPQSQAQAVAAGGTTIVKSESSDSVTGVLQAQQTQQQQAASPASPAAASAASACNIVPSTVQQLARTFERRSSDAASVFAVPSPPSAASSTSSVPAVLGSAAPPPSKAGAYYSMRGAPGKDQTSRKKSKGAKPAKSGTGKARPIKFHEYKGPSSSGKKTSSSAAAAASASEGKSAEETRYELLLKQQQQFLQLQIELQHKVRKGKRE